jgi:ceramide glucosyltransferase
MLSVTLLVVAVVLAGASLALYAPMMALFWSALIQRRGRPQPQAAAGTCRVSILKPLAGCDDDLAANLESFARIEHPSFEILFGVADADDPAFPLARRFLARHPHVEGRLLVTNPQAAINPKVAQLIDLERAATGQVCVISDSNVRVSPSYLNSLLAEFEDPGVGLVTSLIAGTGEQTLGAALENLQICASTAPGIAAVDAVTGQPLTVGKSMAVRRADLERIGGFASVGHVLAEDYVLGQRVRKAGLKARLSFDLVENRNTQCSVFRTLERHTRWAKMRRSLSPPVFALEPLLSPVVVTTLGLLIAPSRTTALLLAVAAFVQTFCAFVSAALLRRQWFAWWYVPLEVVRSYVAIFCWLRAWASRRIAWRGHPFVLQRGSAIVSLSAREPDPSSGRAGFAA